MRFTGTDADIRLDLDPHPEFDAWRWNEYWVPLDLVIEFKRGVYEMALTELARFLPRVNQHNRYLRAGLRGPRPHDLHEGYEPHESQDSDFQTQLPHEAAGLPALPPDTESSRLK